MTKFTYLLVDFCTVIIPFLYSFHPKLRFYDTWKAFFPAVILTGLVFVLWDMYFTSLGVWGFNDQYLTGITIGNLPVEEVLFFICIPYACVFTFHCLDRFINWKFKEITTNRITRILIILCLIAGLLSYQKLYPFFTFLSLAALLAFAKFVLKTEWLGNFYIVYIILLLPFFIVNGILTGTGLENPVVWYNEQEILGIRIGNVPVEDIFYGMELILLNVLIYRYFLHFLAEHYKTTAAPIKENS